jgi:hypothetical protein
MATPIPDHVLVWQFGGKAGNLSSQARLASASDGYNLLLRTNNKYLTYDNGSVAGINVGYTSDPGNKRIHFRLPDNSEREILTGEPVAFGIGGDPAFLCYQNQSVGINLVYSKTPVFEWRIGVVASGQKGEPIPLGAWVALLNERVQPEPDFLVYFSRPGGPPIGGADIGWTTSPGPLAGVLKTTIDLAKLYLAETQSA